MGDVASFIKALPPVKKPTGFVAPTPKKQANINSGLTTIPNVSTYLRPKKPLIIFEYERSGDCKKVREACSVLDLIVEYRPCPGATSGFADKMSSTTLGERKVPFLIDNNPSMYKYDTIISLNDKLLPHDISLLQSYTHCIVTAFKNYGMCSEK